MGGIRPLKARRGAEPFRLDGLFSVLTMEVTQ